MQKNTSKIIKDDSDNYSAWSVPDVQGTHIVNRGSDGNESISAKLREKMQKQKHAEGYEKGYNDGMQAAAKKINEQQVDLQGKMNVLEKLIVSLHEPFEELDRDVEQELVTLSIAIAKQIIRREIKLDPGQIMAVIREALDVLPVSSRNIRISLHPDDAALVEELSSVSNESRQWQTVEDPTLMRGGCTVSTDTSRIDASVESRLAALFSQILGGEREQDQPET